MNMKDEFINFFETEIPEFPEYPDLSGVKILNKLSVDDVKKTWPARSPLLFVDIAIVFEDDDKRRFIIAKKQLQLCEFYSHFPELPRFPIALQGLMMSQAGAILLMSKKELGDLIPVVYEATGLRSHSRIPLKAGDEIFIVADSRCFIKRGYTIGLVGSEIRTLDRKISSFKKMNYIGYNVPNLKYGFANQS